MANPTSGFQLSALPQPLSMPSNLGKFDVGETQQAYANALKNTQQTALLGPQTQAAVAQAGYQTDLAREGIKRLPAETQKLLAQFGADALTAKKSALTSEAQMPHVASTAADQARTQEIAAKVGAEIAKQTQEPTISTGISQAKSAANFAELAAKSPGGIPQQKIKIGGIDYPVFFSQERTPIIGPAATLAAKAVKGEVVRVLKRETDSSGQVFVYVKRSLVHGDGSETEKSQETYAEGQAPKEGFYANPSYSETQQTETSLPPAEQLRGLFTPSQQLNASDKAALATPAQAPVAQPQSVSANEQIASQGVPESLTPNEDYFSRNLRTPMGLDKAKQILGRGMQLDSGISSVGLTPLGTYSQMAPQMGAPTALGSALTAAPVATAPVAATPAKTLATAPVVPPAATSPAQQTKIVTPAPEPQKEQVVIPWKGNVAVSIEDPAAKSQKAFETYAENQKNKPAPLSQKAVNDNTVALGKISTEYKELDSQLNALYEVTRTAEDLQKKFGTGWLQAKIPAPILAQLGLPEGQSFNSAVDALILNLSDKTKFRNFGVVDLIRQSKPNDQDDPVEIRRKINYLNFVISRAKETNLAIRAGIVDYKLPAQKAAQIVDTNYRVGSRDSYENWKNNISTYSDPNEQMSMITGAENYVEQNKGSKDSVILQKVRDIREKLKGLGRNI